MPAYTMNISQSHPYRLLVRNINTNYTRHIVSLLTNHKNTAAHKIFLIIHPCRCLCRGFVQITRTTPLRRTILQFSQIRFTELLTFIFLSTLVFKNFLPAQAG